MRLFVALPLPEAVRQELAEAAGRLGRELPPTRWVPAANLHLTLRFIGETEPDLVRGLGETLAECFARSAPFPLRLSGGGCFPPRRPARVAWVGFAPQPRLDELQANVAAAVEQSLGLAPEGRPFHPHLTLARPRRPWPRSAADRWARAFDDLREPAFEVARGHLMRSRLGPGGARHEALGAYPLQAVRGDGV